MKRLSSLPALSFLRNLNLALGILLLAGCAQYNSGWSAYSAPYYNDPYAQSDFDELLGFGANMARVPPASRAETCRLLLKRQKDLPATAAGIQLHLMVGRLLSDACGDIPRILSGVAAVAGHLSDERTRKLVDIHTETLRRLNTQSRKLGSLERRQRTASQEPDAKETTGSRKDENRMLREKLDAIRSMEKQLDQSSDSE